MLTSLWEKKLEKTRKANQETAKKVAVSDSVLKIQQDSSIIVAKNQLKRAYDIEITRITNLENTLKVKKAKIDSLYAATLILLEKK